MLTANDLSGVMAMLPTPCKEGADGWDVADSVDLEETASMTKKVIEAGIGAIASPGTAGECMSLLWEEKRDYVDTMVQVNKHRIPIFAGATSLGTKETVRQMRAFKDLGADGAFVGLPLWQTPTLVNSVQWFADLSEALPDFPIVIYSNAMFFKSQFPVEFWEGVAKKAPTVMATKVTYGATHMEDDMRVSGGRINFAFNDKGVVAQYRKFGHKVTTCWSTSAAIGPEPLVALMDAIKRDDESTIDAIQEDIRSLPAWPHEGGTHAEYNVQFDKAFMNATDYIHPGPSRAPYRDLPPGWKEAAEAYGRGWAAMRQRYVKAEAPA